MKKIFLFILFFFLITPPKIFAQESLPQDAWLWATVSVDKKLSTKWGVSLDEELRLFDNMSRINLFFTNAGVNYKLTKYLKLSLVYRFINKSQDDKPYSKRHRLYFDISAKKKIKKFTGTYRLRLQGQIRDYYSSDYGGNTYETYMRHKIDVSYDYKKFTPYVAVEFRYQFNNPRFHYGDDYWNRARYYAGVDYSINKRYSAGIYYMIQHDHNNLRAENDFTLGFQFGISL